MLARKINRSKWVYKPYLEPDAIRADGITGCLRTTNDKLSLWRCEDDPEDLDQVFLALATGSKSEGFDRIDIVILHEDELQGAGLAEELTEGDTVVEDLKSRHVDLGYFDLDKLGALARIVAARINSHKSKRRTEAAVKRLVRDAISAGRVRPDELNEELGQKLSRNATSH